MKQKLYIETSIISYLTSHIGRDLVIAARQELTSETWPALLAKFDVFVSALVLQEAGQGDPEASSERLKALEGIPMLDITDTVKALARRLVEDRVIPEGHVEDALHVAVAASNGMDFLLTWNFRHLNNVFTKSRIRDVIEAEGYECPELCSVEELFGEEK